MMIIDSKTSLEIVYYLWDYIIQKDDPYFVLFLAVALLLDQKSFIANEDLSILPQLLTSLSFKTIDQLKITIKK